MSPPLNPAGLFASAFYVAHRIGHSCALCADRATGDAATAAADVDAWQLFAMDLYGFGGGDDIRSRRCGMHRGFWGVAGMDDNDAGRIQINVRRSWSWPGDGQK